MEKLPIRIKTMLNILCYLVKKAPEAANSYEIREKGKVGTQPTVLKVLGELKSRRLLDVETTIRKARGGKPSERYVLTRDGVMFLLNHPRQMKEHRLNVDLVVGKYVNLFPEIFGFWPLFKQEGIIDLARCSLRQTANYGFDGSYFSLNWGTRWVRMGETFEAVFFRTIMHPDQFEYPGPSFHLDNWLSSRWQRWLKAMKASPELRSEVASAINSENSSLEERMTKLREDLKANQDRLKQL